MGEVSLELHVNVIPDQAGKQWRLVELTYTCYILLILVKIQSIATYRE